MNFEGTSNPNESSMSAVSGTPAGTAHNGSGSGKRNSNTEKKTTRLVIVPPSMEYEGDVETSVSLSAVVEKRFQAAREVETVSRMHFLKPASNMTNSMVAVNEKTQESKADYITSHMNGNPTNEDYAGNSYNSENSNGYTKDEVTIAHGRGILRRKVVLSADYRHALSQHKSEKNMKGVSSDFLSRINSEGPQSESLSNTLADALRESFPEHSTARSQQEKGASNDYYETVYEGEWLWGVPHGVGKGQWNVPTPNTSSGVHGIPRNHSLDHMHSQHQTLPYQCSFGQQEEMTRPAVYPGSAASSVNAVHAMEQFSDGNSVAWPNYTQMPGVYEGNWTNGLPHGTGKLSIRLGDSVEGKWICGIPHGDMAVHVAGGGLLLAVFVNGRPHGCAVFAWPSGVNVYEARQYLYGRRVSSQTISPRQLRIFASARTVWKAALHYWETANREELPSAFLHRTRSMGSESDSGGNEIPDVPRPRRRQRSMDDHQVSSLQRKNMPYSEFNATNVITLLRNATVHDVDGGKVGSEGTGVVTANAEDTVSDCLGLLTRNNIYSVPVWDDEKHQYVAIIHVLDIFSFMLDIVARHPKVMKNPQSHLREAIMHRQLFVRQPIRAIVDRIVPREDASAAKMSKATGSNNSSPDDKTKSMASSRRAKAGSSPLSPLYKKRMVGEDSSGTTPADDSTGGEELEEERLSDTSSEQVQSFGQEPPEMEPAAPQKCDTPRKFMFSSEFLSVPQGSPLLFACRLLCRGVHAVPVVNAEGKIHRIVTVADIIRFLATRIQLLGDLAHKTVAELRLGSGAENSGLVVAKLNEKAMDVMQRIREAGSSAAPVVDEYGSMVTNLSVSDAKTIARRNHFDALQLPLSQFFVEIDKPMNTVNPSIYTRPNSTLASVLLTLASTRIHQVCMLCKKTKEIVLLVEGVLVTFDLLFHRFTSLGKIYNLLVVSGEWTL